MLQPYDIIQKLNEDFLLSRLNEIDPASIFPVRKLTGEEKRIKLSFRLPGGLCETLAKAGKNKPFNKYLLFITALYIWIRKFSGAGQQVIGIPSFQQETANKLFLFLADGPDDTVRSFLQQVYAELQTMSEKADYRHDTLTERYTRNHKASFDRLQDIGIAYNKMMDTDWQAAREKVFFYIEEQPDQEISLWFCADDTLFTSGEGRFAGLQYMQILHNICMDLSQPLRKVQALSEEDYSLLRMVNDSRLEYEDDCSVIAYFRKYALEQPEQVAVIFNNRSFSYREIDFLSDQVAAVLSRDLQVKPDEIVGLIAGQNEQRVIAILGILKAGAAYLPIKHDFPLKRINFMLGDCSCRILLADEMLEDAMAVQMEVPHIVRLPLTTTAVFTEIDRKSIRKEQLFVVLYTSGSSGNPKGVLIEHGNMTDRLLGEIALYGLSGDTTTIQTSNYAFDSSLLDLFLPFMTGGRMVIPNDKEIFQFESLVTLIENYQVTDLQANPNFLKGFIDTCISMHVTFRDSLRRIWSGGESLNDLLVHHVNTHFEKVMISNHYGPTEGTVDALVYKDIRRFERNIIGKPVHNMQVWILDGYQQLQAVNMPGEICVSGKGLARGYLNLETLTAEKFIPHPYYPDARLYRTGDMGRMLPDGNIEYLGRIDDQIKIRGYRIELGEVEHAILVQPLITQVTILAKTSSDGSKYLLAFFVAEKQISIPELRKALASSLPDFMIPLFMLQLDALPVTSTGKIDRKALLAIDETVPADTFSDGPLEMLEIKITAMWSNVLNKEKISVDSNFFEIGGQSLKAAQLMFMLYKDLQVKLELRDIFTYPTIRGLAAYIREQERNEFISVPRTDVKEYYAVSAAQQRIWMASQGEEASLSYNIPEALELEGEVQPEVLRKAFYAMMERHETLRTVFVLDETGLHQHIRETYPENAGAFQYTDLSMLQQEGISAAVQALGNSFVNTRFDFETGPLIKMHVVRSGENSWLLMFSMHHIISDEWSIKLYIEEFLLLYRHFSTGEPHSLAVLPVQYKDYAEWTGRYGNPQSSRDFWLKLFAGELSSLNLPLDRPRTDEYGRQEMYDILLEETVVERIRRLSYANEVTVNMLLFAVFNVLLHKICGQEDIITGTITSGRNHPQLEPLIGCFVHTIPVRNQVVPDKSFAVFLEEVKERLLAAFSHEDYELHQLLQELDIKREFNRTPLIDVLFGFENQIEINAEQFSVRPYIFDYKPYATFDISLNVTEMRSVIELSWSYNSAVFDRETIQMISDCFTSILYVILEDPASRLKDIRLPVQQSEAVNDTEGVDGLFSFSKS